MHRIRRQEKVKMYLYEDYFGNPHLGFHLRVIIGVFLILLGTMNTMEISLRLLDILIRFLSLGLGIIALILPFFKIMLNISYYFKDEFIQIEITDEIIKLSNNKVTSEIKFSSLDSVEKRKNFFSLYKGKILLYSVPFSILTKKQYDKLNKVSNDNKK